ncbi:MAG: 2-dehydropantoate 2-reductase [Oscillospiraceae bacterium]
MKIAIIGAGAMGGLFSAYLSTKNEVTVIDVNKELIDKLNKSGLSVEEADGKSSIYRPNATADASNMEAVDLIILFVKSMYSESALYNNRNIIDKNTFLLTLQNGSGHEAVLSKFCDNEHIVIGTTQHNAAITALGAIRHGGSGKTVIGCLSGDSVRVKHIADVFSSCNIPCVYSDEVQKMIWDKLFTNVCVSALTGALQVPMGYIAENANAWAACCQLAKEAVDVAAVMGMTFSCDEKIAEMKALCTKNCGGLTSIYADLRDGRRTEVDTISGSVVRAGEKYNIATPTHSFLVNLIHAMEGKS